MATASFIFFVAAAILHMKLSAECEFAYRRQLDSEDWYTPVGLFLFIFGGFLIAGLSAGGQLA